MSVTQTTQELSSATARKIFVWQMLFFGALPAVSALVNGYSVVADLARMGAPLPRWKPMTWESSSHLLIWLLIPVLGWWLARFPHFFIFWVFHLDYQM